MENKYNAFEILLIAEKIERNGAVFYRKASTLFDKPKLANMLREIGGWETRHEEIFAVMKKELSSKMSERTFFDPENYMSSNPQVMASLADLAMNPDPAWELTGKQSKKQILEKALKKEKDIILFYRGLKKFARDRTARDKIKNIIKEEKRHIGILKQSLMAIKL